MKILITGSWTTWKGFNTIGPKETQIYAMDRTNFDLLDVPSCLKK